MITTLFEDSDILVVEKPVGLASQETKEQSNYLQKELNIELQPIHRLDQRVSGLMLFAKNKKSHVKLSEAFATNQVKKIYKAVVGNMPPKPTDTLTHWLLKDGEKSKSKAFNKEVAHSQKATLTYTVLQSSLKYHLLEIELHTGRFHQIRAQLAAINCPIVGDVKYGFKRTTPDGSIFLQSNALDFAHPISKEAMHFELPLPELWKKYGIL